ncbi:uncharacterized protein LOC135384324 [Ornithodoros turicata]|uniref:uncharacterized protein LOC135384324 n=1 Tax=Ornithodoros turicata TaxID=34597 RepID=UPI0031399D0D
MPRPRQGLTALQINLNKSKAATLTLLDRIRTSRPNIVAIQEPYMRRLQNDPILAQVGYTMIANKDGTDVVTLIQTDNYDVFPILSHKELNITNLRSKEKRITIANIYLAPSNDLNSLQKLQQHIDRHPNESILIIMGDFNAKTPLWGGTAADHTGDTIVDFLFLNGLMSLNDRNSPPSFDGPRRTSWIDITVVNEDHREEYHGWQILDAFSCSDHRYASFDIFSKPSKYIYKTTKKSI